MDRVSALREILQQNPEDNFARYGLAMEFAKQGKLAEAVLEFKHLLSINPDYIAAYYHAGQTLENLGQYDDARKIYQEGIKVASRLKDNKAKGELESVLDLLG
jgi:tetratricopeptide (TPR) repeat protein